MPNVRNWTYEQLLRVGTYGTRSIGRHFGESFPFYYICEYPRCGGTWLGRMASSYLDIPFPQHPRLPLAMTCVIHNHWKYDHKLRRVFYLYRDGRDVLTSYFFYRMRGIAQKPDSPFYQKMYRRYEEAFGKGFDTTDAKQYLPKFIELEMNNPRGARQNWADHIRGWHAPAREHIAYLSYEQLLTDPHPTLSRCLEQLTGEPTDPDKLTDAIARYDFAKLTGRKPGQEDTGSFMRKGVAGDWKNHFTREAGEVFDKYAGDVLIRLGYEPDNSWVTTLPNYEQTKASPPGGESAA